MDDIDLLQELECSYGHKIKPQNTRAKYRYKYIFPVTAMNLEQNDENTIQMATDLSTILCLLCHS